MLDYYEEFSNVYRRLQHEYEKYGRLIIAVDFDDTLSDYHKDGKHLSNVINLLKRWKNHAFIYIWTARDEERQKEVIAFCKENNIPYENINIGCTDVPEVDYHSRKPFYSVLLDDRAGLSVCVKALTMLINKIEEGEKKL